MIFSLSHKTCSEILHELGGVEWVWVGYENGGWEGYSNSIVDEITDFEGGFLWHLHIPDQPNLQYYMWFWGYEADGEPYGLHHLCAIQKEIGVN